MFERGVEKEISVSIEKQMQCAHLWAHTMDYAKLEGSLPGATSS
jgi:hypothetical protein